MSSSSSALLWLLPASLLMCVPARAASPLSFSTTRSAVVGESPAEVRLTPRVAGQLQVEARCGEQEWSAQAATVPEQVVVLPLEGLAEGHHRCTCDLVLTVPEHEPAPMHVDFEVARLPHLSWEPLGGGLDLEGHALQAHASRPLATVTLRVLGESGAPLTSSEADLSEPAAPRFTWEGDEEVLQLVLDARDAWGFHSELTVWPWSLVIPHEDVVFASGSSEITDAEAPKLERAWTPVDEAMGRYGEVVQLSLYVAGYTDTVGAAAFNQGLSEARARSIARWFRARGFPGPLYYQGFGEEVLAEPTPDQTDEPANRRAVYVISIEAPAPSEDLPRDAWRALR